MFDEVLDISPADALWTITGRGESVIETVELGVVFPLGGVVLVFGRGSATKIERVVFRGNRPSITQGTVLTCVGISHLSPRTSDGVG